MEGNASICPVFSPNMYDQDECFQDGDAGLVMPGAYTLTGNQVIPCMGAPNQALNRFCTTAQWGQDIDIIVTGPGFVNILMDWDQNGVWALNPASFCPGGVVPEHVLVDFPIPFGFSGPLSALNPPAIAIGPNAGFVWARFTISDVPVNNNNWNGAGDFMDGETEDYLLEVSLTSALNKIRGDEIPFNVIPNPANDAFRVELALLKREQVRIDMIGLDGRIMQTFYDTALPKGTHTLKCSLAPMEVPSGLYLIRVRTTSGTQAYKRLVIQR